MIPDPLACYPRNTAGEVQLQHCIATLRCSRYKLFHRISIFKSWPHAMIKLPVNKYTHCLQLIKAACNKGVHHLFILSLFKNNHETKSTSCLQLIKAATGFNQDAHPVHLFDLYNRRGAACFSGASPSS